MVPIPLALLVVTLNVYQTMAQPARRYAAIHAELTALAPDVVTFQEVRRLGPKRTSVDDVLPHYHRAIDGAYVGYHLAILSKHPIRRQFRVPLPKSPDRIALGAVLDVHGTEVLVVTTHLDWQLDHHAQRQAQLEAIVKVANEFKGPVVLTGDLNFGDGEPEEQALPLTYRDAWRVLNAALPGFTWDKKSNPMALRGSLPGEPSRRLDRILARGLLPMSVKLRFSTPIAPGLFPSDHFGVSAYLRLGP